MPFFSQQKYRYKDVHKLDSIARQAEIERLEAERDRINTDIEKLMLDYAALTGFAKAVKGAKKIGRSPKDHAYYFKKSKNIQK